MLTCRLNAWYTNIADNRCMPSNNWYATVPPHPARLDECHEPSDPGGYDKKNSLAVWRVWIHHWFFGTKQNGRRKRTTFILSSILLSKQACPIAKVCERTLVTAWLQTRISKLKQPKLWQQIFEFQALRFDLHSHGCNMVCITANVFELTALCPVQMQTHSQHHGNIQSKLEHQKKQNKKNAAFHQSIWCYVIPLKLTQSIVDHYYGSPCLLSCRKAFDFTWYLLIPKEKWKPNWERKCIVATWHTTIKAQTSVLFCCIRAIFCFIPKIFSVYVSCCT